MLTEYCVHNYVSLRVKEIACSTDRAVPGDGLGETQQYSLWQFAGRAYVVLLTSINHWENNSLTSMNCAKEHLPLEFGRWTEVSFSYS